MKRLIVILILCVMTLGAYASYFEVQVPMSSHQQTTMLSQQPLTSGRFQTSVNSLDENGHAYAPGQSSSGKNYAPGGPRRVSHDDDEDDPYMGNVVPLGDTPWFIMLLLSLGYIAFRLFRKKRVE